MRPDDKSAPFTFHKNVFKQSENANKMQNCRKKLEDKFDQSDEKSSSTRSDRSVLSVISLNDTRKALRTSTERISKTLSNFRTTLGSFSQVYKSICLIHSNRQYVFSLQRFRIPTKRRQILEEGPMTPNCETPQTVTRKVLGRTPTKLYSPFSIESPYHPTTCDKENLPPPRRVFSRKN